MGRAATLWVSPPRPSRTSPAARLRLYTLAQPLRATRACWGPWMQVGAPPRGGPRAGLGHGEPGAARPSTARDSAARCPCMGHLLGGRGAAPPRPQPASCASKAARLPAASRLRLLTRLTFFRFLPRPSRRPPFFPVVFFKTGLGLLPVSEEALTAGAGARQGRRAPAPRAFEPAAAPAATAGVASVRHRLGAVARW